MELVINSFGVSINRDNGAFVVSGKDGRKRIPVGNVTSIQMSKGSQISSDAILLAIENEIDLFFVEKSGQPAGRIWSPKYGSISTIRKGQLEFCSSADGLKWIVNVIVQKIENQEALLLMMQSDDEETARMTRKAITMLEEVKEKVEEVDGRSVADAAPAIRGLEGYASTLYFKTLNMYLPESLRFETRAQHPAMDVTNAFLNYGYGVLYGKVESALIKAGIDPYIGVLHRDNYNRPVLVYDVIELYRVWVDYVVYSIMAQGVVTDEYYSVKEDGSYWLENLGRRVLIQSLNDYLDEIVVCDNVQRSRAYQIVLYAQRLAQQLKEKCGC